MSRDPDAPLLRIVHGGDPGEAALAALTLAVATRVRSGSAEPTLRSRWADRAHGLRHPDRAGPGAWRRSGRPRD